MSENSASHQQQKPTNKALKAVASTFGVLVGFAGIEHGFFEFLQGNVATNDVMIHAIGPSQQFWEYGTETALTVVPNFFVTGILSMILGLIVMVWAFAFVNRRYGAGVLLFLSVLLWLVGGGFAPIFMAIFACIAAFGINRPLSWWHTHFSSSVRGALAKTWPWSLVLFVVVFFIGVEIAIFGYPLLWVFNAELTYSVQILFAVVMLIFLPLSIFSALAHDLSRFIKK